MVKIGGGKSRLLVAIVLIVLALACVAGVAVFTKRTHGKQPVKQVVELGPTTSISLGEMIINLADADESRYLKLDAMLEVTGNALSKEEEEEFKTRLRDSVIEVAGLKCMDDLVKSGGKEVLKKEIAQSASKRLAENAEGSESARKVVKVYFNEFVMQ